ncbi:MAG: fumarate hydratase [Clostridia bacterium]
MRELNVKIIEDAVCSMFIEANTILPRDIKARLFECAKSEPEPLAQSILQKTIQNADIAESTNIPICQDTGMAFVFAKIGQEIHFTGGNLRDAINNGVRRAYADGFLRKSVADPITRKNTNDNTPAIIYFDFADGDSVELTALPKGFGSENMSKIKMMNPTSSEEDIINFVTETVHSAGGNPCPPTVIGVGIGGSFDYAAFLSKKALTREIGKTDTANAALEEKILSSLNKTNIGPQGLGGKTTSLWVNIETSPTHIASLPVAVNVSCHATRHITRIL